MIDSNAKATVNMSQSFDPLNVFSCLHCDARQRGLDYCDKFQAKGRCRAALLGDALRVGAVQIVLQLPAGRVSQ